MVVHIVAQVSQTSDSLTTLNHPVTKKPVHQWAVNTDDVLLKAILDISSKFTQFEQRAEEDRIRVYRLVQQFEVDNFGSAKKLSSKSAAAKRTLW